MAEPITDERLAELRALADAATPSAPLPWSRGELSRSNEIDDADFAVVVAARYGVTDPAHAKLIVAAVNALPELLAEVERLRGELADSERTVDATRRMATAANTAIRTVLFDALGQEDDGLTPLLDTAAAVSGQMEEERARLTRERDEAQAEVARLVELGEERYVQQLVDETAIKSMSIRNGTMDMDLSVAKSIAASLVGAAKAMLGDAPNYTETVAWDVNVAEQPDTYTFVVQRHAPGTLTPHQARQKAERELDEARAELAKAREAIAGIRQLHRQYRDVYATAESGDSCSACNTADVRVPWPCQTIRELSAPSAVEAASTVPADAVTALRDAGILACGADQTRDEEAL